MAEVLNLYPHDPNSTAPRLFDIAMWISDAAEQNGVDPDRASRIGAASIRRILDAFES